MKRRLGTVMLCFTAFVCNAQDDMEAGLADFARDVLALGSKDRRLSSTSISEISGVSLIRRCEGPLPDESGAYYVCTFVPGVEQAGLFKIVKFSSASRQPEPDDGGSITWSVDPNISCVDKKSMSKAFRTRPTFPRYPVIPEAFSSGGDNRKADAYDLIISRHQPPAENTFIAISEDDGCATRIKLYKNETAAQ